ncbi:putative membrane protein DUF2207 [Terracoccus luteus]|uniref:Putative membrane protein DUF2207 n=1 Tax=Terracoccus luteus TaxID=53356 RepID=A0A495XST7_9MICO|nr:DUF2207 domain-containing protein [Terracoccus luteus]RKT76972.1 putative membrane protein DUF2207 [Terracoccus luteus]
MMRHDTQARGDARGDRGAARALGAVAVAFVAALLVLLPAGSASAAGGDRMSDFAVTYDLQADGSMRVTERITWVFPAGEERHGILRNIVVRMGYGDQEGKYRYYDMTDVSVSSPTGAPDAFRVSEFGASDQIRIGSSDEYTRGTQRYEVRYTLHHVLNPIAAGQDGGTAEKTVELNYNVFGANETTPRDRVSVTVNAPAASTRTRCFEGVKTSDTPCSGTPGNPTRFGAEDLSSGDAMTVIASYPATAFDADLAPDVRDGDADSSLGSGAAPAANAAAWAGGIGAPVLAAAVMGALVWTRGRDERYAGLTPGLSPTSTDAAAPVMRGGRPVVAVQFQPPAGVAPGLVGTVIDETANPIDVSATVIDLAVRGFLRIEETGGEGLFKRTDWTLTRLPFPEGERAHAYERTLLDGIFRTGDVVTLSSLKNTFSSTLKRVQREMYDEVVTRGWFRRSPQTQRGAWQTLGIVIAAAGALLLFYGGSAISVLLGAGFSGGAVLGGGLILSGIIVWVLGGRMAAKTPEGSAVNAQSLGFKEYLLTAEAKQIAFDEASMVFSRYLPYAVVFGVADRWAGVFADVARAADAAGQSLVMPTWYVWSGTTFPDFGSIANGVESFSTTSTGTFTSTPGSSGSSGFSSGGGFSGGGGGGSSSGSW